MIANSCAPAALVRNTVYLDGGSIWWMPGLASGELGRLVNGGLSISRLQDPWAAPANPSKATPKVPSSLTTSAIR